MEDTVHTLQDQVNAALLGGDWETLNNLVAPDARIIGPKGFIIDRDTWIGVHKESEYDQVRLEPSETETRTYDNAGIRFDLVDSECRYRGGNHHRPLPGLPGLGHRPQALAARGGAVHLSDIEHGLLATLPRVQHRDEPQGSIHVWRSHPRPCGAQRDLRSRPLMPAPPHSWPPVPPPESPARSSTLSAARP